MENEADGGLRLPPSLSELRRTSRLIYPTRSVIVMRKSSGQSPDNCGCGCRRDQMLQGVSGDEAESSRDLVVEHLSELGQDVQHHRGTECDAIGARGAMDRLPERDKDESEPLQQEIRSQVTRAVPV